MIKQTESRRGWYGLLLLLVVVLASVFMALPTLNPEIAQLTDSDVSAHFNKKYRHCQQCRVTCNWFTGHCKTVCRIRHCGRKLYNSTLNQITVQAPTLPTLAGS